MELLAGGGSIRLKSDLSKRSASWGLAFTIGNPGKPRTRGPQTIPTGPTSTLHRNASSRRVLRSPVSIDRRLVGRGRYDDSQGLLKFRALWPHQSAAGRIGGDSVAYAGLPMAVCGCPNWQDRSGAAITCCYSRGIWIYYLCCTDWHLAMVSHEAFLAESLCARESSSHRCPLTLLWIGCTVRYTSKRCRRCDGCHSSKSIASVAIR